MVRMDSKGNNNVDEDENTDVAICSVLASLRKELSTASVQDAIRLPSHTLVPCPISGDRFYLTGETYPSATTLHQLYRFS